MPLSAFEANFGKNTCLKSLGGWVVDFTIQFGQSFRHLEDQRLPELD